MMLLHKLAENVQTLTSRHRNLWQNDGVDTSPSAHPLGGLSEWRRASSGRRPASLPGAEDQGRAGPIRRWLGRWPGHSGGRDMPPRLLRRGRGGLRPAGLAARHRPDSSREHALGAAGRAPRRTLGRRSGSARVPSGSVCALELLLACCLTHAGAGSARNRSGKRSTRDRLIPALLPLSRRALWSSSRARRDA